jgi:hypothetical protein
MREATSAACSSDEGVGLAAAVGHLELQHRLAALACQPPQYVAGQRLHAEGGVGAVEEHGRLAIDRPRRAGAHAVQVGGELVQGEAALAHVVAQNAELMPGGCAHGVSSAMVKDGLG